MNTQEELYATPKVVIKEEQTRVGQALTRLTESELYTSVQVRALIAAGEGPTVELKSLWDLRRSRGQAPPLPTDVGGRRPLKIKQVRRMILENIVAFANTAGGTLIMGVNDDLGLSGHRYGPRELLVFVTAAGRFLDPCPRVRAQLMQLDDVSLLLFKVAAATEPIALPTGEYRYRAGSSNLRVSRELIQTRMDAEESLRQVGVAQEKALGYVQKLALMAAGKFSGQKIETVLDEVDVEAAEELLVEDARYLRN